MTNVAVYSAAVSYCQDINQSVESNDYTLQYCSVRAIQVLHNTDGGVGVSNFPGGGGERYEGVRFNVTSVTRGWVGGGPISRKKRFVILEWLPRTRLLILLGS